MTLLDDFLTERLRLPWPSGNLMYGGGARAAELLAVYTEIMRADERRVPSPKEFGAALAEKGHEPERDPDGHYYPGLTVETRSARAQSAAIATLAWEHRSDPTLPDVQSWKEHRERVHDGADQCLHWEMPTAEIERLRPLMAVWLEAHEEELTAITEEYRPYLDWHPGKPNPGIAIEEAQRIAAISLTRAEVDVLQGRLNALVESDRAVRADYDTEVERLSGPPVAVAKELTVMAGLIADAAEVNVVQPGYTMSRHEAMKTTPHPVRDWRTTHEMKIAGDNLQRAIAELKRLEGLPRRAETASGAW